LAFGDFAFSRRLHEQITRARWHFLEPVHVDKPRCHIKEEGLEIRVEGVKRLRIGNKAVDLRGERFHLGAALEHWHHSARIAA
jgi:hypothetical protein